MECNCENKLPSAHGQYHGRVLGILHWVGKTNDMQHTVLMTFKNKIYMHYISKNTYISGYTTIKCKRNINPKFSIVVLFNGRQEGILGSTPK